ncbi:MAG: YaiI/YqxD family protein [Limnochordia bacterium]|jgi:uncharacterized protein YaiI (UPF0178 family)
MQVLVDADACPRSVLAILQELAPKYCFSLLTISSFHHQIDHAHHLVADDGPDAADWLILRHLQRGDIVITQDWGLASLVLARGGRAISPYGREYRGETIDFLLEERYLQAKHRRRGGRTRGPAPRSPEDDVRFRDRFIALLTGEVEREE